MSTSAIPFAARLALDQAIPPVQLASLARYVARQLDANFPAGGVDADAAAIALLLPATIERLRPILVAVRCFNAVSFEFYNSLQYTTFLYLLSNEASVQGGCPGLPERLFCLNRAFNAIDLFYSVRMPPLFFISHGIGSVLGNADYGNRLVIFQNVTVGRVGENRPRIGDDVVLYAGAIVTGRTVIGNNCVVGAGTVLHNVAVPDNMVVSTKGGQLVMNENRGTYIDLYFDSAAKG